MSPKAKGEKTANTKARKKTKKLAAKLAAETGSQAEATAPTAGGAPGDSVSEAGSAPADEVEAEPPTGSSPGPQLEGSLINHPSDPARGEGRSDDEGEPDLDLTIDRLSHQAQSLNPVTVDPGDEIVIVNTSGLGDTALAHAFLGQKGTVIRGGIRSCYIELDRGLRVWIGLNRLALP
jgi:hypothetical protein